MRCLLNFTSRHGSRVVIALFLVATGTALFPQASNATLAGFNAGNIMSDAVMSNRSSMNEAQIQAFLKNKNSCNDSNLGRLTGYNANEGWLVSNGKTFYYNLRNGKFVCMADESFNGESAARIIWQAAQDYTINPQVLIVLLQKEQGLVTDTWPNKNHQYAAATGYNCPDNGNGCNSANAGFKTQVRKAAELFRTVLNGGWSNYPVGVNYVQYHPNPSCGGTNVDIQNRATSSLYRYTPYQPNQAALNAGYGSGNSCSAYGNRNFYNYFTDWFGSSTTSNQYSWQLVEHAVYSDPSRSQRLTNKATARPGETLYIRVKARNTGSTEWGSFMKMGTFRPLDRVSIFRAPSWQNGARAAVMTEASVAYGQTGTFDFAVKAPSSPGTYREHFNLVAEGRAWLNDVGFYYDINVVEPTTKKATNNKLHPGESLQGSEYLLSPDTQTTLSVDGQGVFRLHTNFRQSWNTPSGGAGARLAFQHDGNIVLYNKQGSAIWASHQLDDSPESLQLQTDGNLVAYNTDGEVIWTTGTIHNPNNLGYVNTELGSGLSLRPGQVLETANRKYRLTLQTDGNLVIYARGWNAIWASGTVGRSASYLKMQTDGNLVIYNSADQAIWNTGTMGRGASYLKMQTDGNLVIYNSADQAIWNTGTMGR